LPFYFLYDLLSIQNGNSQVHIAQNCFLKVINICVLHILCFLECQVMAKANMVWASGVKLYLAEVIKKLNHLKIKSKRSSLFLLVALHE
jgi:hypothetical protein